MIDSKNGITQQDAQQLVSDVIRGWPSDENFRAADVLLGHPALEDHCSAVIDLAYEEYCRRSQRGESIDAEGFARQFPSIEENLLRLVELNQIFDRDPGLLQSSGDIAWPAVGQNFLEFHLLEELGRGMFSRVFLAHELELGERPIVLKVCWGGREEAYTLGQLQHPHVVPVHSVRHDPATDLTAISLPFLGRATLFDVLSVLFSEGGKPRSGRDFIDSVQLIDRSDNPTPPAKKAKPSSKWGRSYVDTVARIGGQLADALAHSHRLGVYHGDIKPSNILVTNDGDALLFDFNLSVNALGTTSRFGGTLPYMAPEQLQRFLNRSELSQRAVDPRAELFSLGVTLFETLCGQHPFGPIDSDRLRHDTAAILLERQQAGPKSLRELNGNVDSTLAALIESTLAFDPAARPQTVEAFAVSLKALIVPHQRVRRRVFNHPRLSIAMLALTMLGVTCSAAAWLAIPPRHLRDLETAEAEFRDGQFVDAAQAAGAILIAEPDCQRAQFLRARSLMKLGRYDDALREFNRLCEQRPADDRMASCRAYCLACVGVRTKKMGYSGDAVLQLESIKQLSAQDLAYFNNLGFCLVELRQIEQAEPALVAALEMDASQLRLHMLLAEVERSRILTSPSAKMDSHVSAARQHLQTALEAGLTSDVERSDVLFLQGMVDATVSLRLLGRDADKAARLRDDAIESLRAAVRHGLSEERLLFVAGVNPTLKQAAGFEELRAEARQNLPDDRLRWLMAPAVMDDILPTLPCQ